MMEDSLGSFVDKGFSPEGEEDDPEESGWTAYFEDLSPISRGRHQGSNSRTTCVSSSSSSSLVSDAAWKPTTANHAVACSSMATSPQIPRKLNFKKTRAREISYDDSLEDTASSPVNSPKKTDMNHRKTDSLTKNNSQGKGDGGADHFSRLQENGRNVEMNDFNGKKKKNIECTDLKKRGLCLVPLSMLVNYLG